MPDLSAPYHSDANMNDMALTANPKNAMPNTAAATPSPSRQAITKTQATIAALVAAARDSSNRLPPSVVSFLLSSKGEAVPLPL